MANSHAVRNALIAAQHVGVVDAEDFALLFDIIELEI